MNNGKIEKDLLTYDEELRNEIHNWIKQHSGDSYHRVIGFVNSLQEKGFTDENIAKILRETK
jgi:hypothetical protein